MKTLRAMVVICFWASGMMAQECAEKNIPTSVQSQNTGAETDIPTSAGVQDSDITTNIPKGLKERKRWLFDNLTDDLDNMPTACFVKNGYVTNLLSGRNEKQIDATIHYYVETRKKADMDVAAINALFQANCALEEAKATKKDTENLLKEFQKKEAAFWRQQANNAVLQKMWLQLIANQTEMLGHLVYATIPGYSFKRWQNIPTFYFMENGTYIGPVFEDRYAGRYHFSVPASWIITTTYTSDSDHHDHAFPPGADRRQPKSFRMGDSQQSQLPRKENQQQALPRKENSQQVQLPLRESQQGQQRVQPRRANQQQTQLSLSDSHQPSARPPVKQHAQQQPMQPVQAQPGFLQPQTTKTKKPNR